eukprot:3578445-Amphidinium_carterae.1
MFNCCPPFVKLADLPKRVNLDPNTQAMHEALHVPAVRKRSITSPLLEMFTKCFSFRSFQGSVDTLMQITVVRPQRCKVKSQLLGPPEPAEKMERQKTGKTNCSIIVHVGELQHMPACISARCTYRDRRALYWQQDGTKTPLASINCPGHTQNSQKQTISKGSCKKDSPSGT